MGDWSAAGQGRLSHSKMQSPLTLVDKQRNRCITVDGGCVRVAGRVTALALDWRWAMTLDLVEVKRWRSSKVGKGGGKQGE